MVLFKHGKKAPVDYEPVKKQKKETGEELGVSDGMRLSCSRCKKSVYKKELDENKICPYCGGYFRLTAWERIEAVCDKDTFAEMDMGIMSENPMGYPDYHLVIEKAQEVSGLNDAVVTGTCRVGNAPCVMAVMDSHFMMGSMGSVVGEKLTRAVECATEEQLPVVIFCTSGGARMQEGIFSLMQMAKVSAALKRHSDAGLLYVSVLTDPTTGGVTASFAMLGDIILAEPGALVGFAGQRVIKNTIRQSLPDGFQTAQFQLEHGFVDKIVERRQLRRALTWCLRLHDPDFEKKFIKKKRRKAAEESREPSVFSGGAVPRSVNELSGDNEDGPSEENGKKEIAGEPSDVVRAARKPSRPTALEMIRLVLDNFSEFHGDRLFGDDPAMVGGIGLLDGCPVTAIGIQKGHTLQENVARNFGTAHPEGYRKALRLMKQAEKFHRPIVTFINTSGAYCGIGAEERGEGEAIARNLFEMSALTVPIISVFLGEGGSGGALALAVSDQVWMLENSMYSILSPEGFASILWKDVERSREAARVMRLAPLQLLEDGIADRIIPEAPEGIEQDPAFTADQIREQLKETFAALLRLPAEVLVWKRYDRFRKYGKFREDMEPEEDGPAEMDEETDE